MAIFTFLKTGPRLSEQLVQEYKFNNISISSVAVTVCRLLQSPRA